MKIATDTNHVERLAASYLAYHKAVVEDDNEGILVWAPILLDAMAMTATFPEQQTHIERLLKATRHVVAQLEAA